MNDVLNEFSNTALKNLYTALFLGGARLTKDDNYEVYLALERIHLIQQYLKRNNINLNFNYEVSDKGSFIFSQTLMAHKLYREWTSKGDNVDYISPGQLNVNVMNLWVSLFSHKGKKRLYIPSSHFSLEARETFQILFNDIMHFEIVANSMYFTIVQVKEWFIQSYQYRRPLYELNVLLNVLGPGEVSTLRDVRKQFDLKRGVQYI